MKFTPTKLMLFVIITLSWQSAHGINFHAIMEASFDFFNSARLDVHYENIVQEAKVQALNEDLINGVQSNNFEQVAWLLQQGAQPNTCAFGIGWTMLHLAVLQRNLTIVILLVESGADIYASTRAFGHTPYHFADQRDYHAITNYLQQRHDFLEMKVWRNVLQQKELFANIDAHFPDLLIYCQKKK